MGSLDSPGSGDAHAQLHRRPGPSASSLKARNASGLETFLIESADELEQMDLIALAAAPPAITSMLSAFMWARAIPLVMARRRTEPGYGVDEELRDDAIWTLRDAGEAYLAEARPADAFEAHLQISVVAEHSGEMQDEMAAMVERVQDWLVSQIA